MTTPKHVSEPLPVYGGVPMRLDADTEGSLKALQRAAIRARQVAQQTGTDLIVVRSGKVVRVTPGAKAAP